MPDGLLQISDTDVIDFRVILVRLAIAAAYGVVVAAFAKRRCDSSSDPTLSLTLIMMCVLIAMATQIIGSNIARAFSLVGALSIVRFRTAVASTQDVAFVLAAVVVGMAVGSGQLTIASVGLVFVCLISLTPHSAISESPVPATQTSLRLQLQATLGAEKTWLAILNDLTSFCELTSVETVRRGSAFLYEYRVILRDNIDASDAAQKLSVLPQVESVAVKGL